jgi:group I intron endonuclease
MEKIVKSYIYSLIDPVTEEIRYIGKTVNPSQRLSAHIKSGYKKGSHKECWIYGLLEKNLKPKMNIIEECLDDSWIEREKYYIRTLPNLTNHTEGGDSPSGHKMSEETRKKMSESRRGEQNSFFGKSHSNESRKLISKSIKEIPKNEGYGFTGKNHKESSREIISKRAKERANRGELPKLPIMSGKDNPASKERIFISPSGEIFIVYNLRKFCKENSLSHNIIFRNINNGPIEKPTDKKTLDRQRTKSLNTIGWEVIQK